MRVLISINEIFVYCQNLSNLAKFQDDRLKNPLSGKYLKNLEIKRQMYGSQSTQACLSYICLLFSGFWHIWHFACFYQQYCSVTWINYRFVYIGAGVRRKTTERYEWVCTSAIKKLLSCVFCSCVNLEIWWNYLGNTRCGIELGVEYSRIFMFVVVQEPPAVAVSVRARGSEKMNAGESDAKLENQYIKI